MSQVIEVMGWAFGTDAKEPFTIRVGASGDNVLLSVHPTKVPGVAAGAFGPGAYEMYLSEENVRQLTGWLQGRASK
jgi:hypothetical protein